MRTPHHSGCSLLGLLQIRSLCIAHTRSAVGFIHVNLLSFIRNLLRAVSLCFNESLKSKPLVVGHTPNSHVRTALELQFTQVCSCFQKLDVCKYRRCLTSTNSLLASRQRPRPQRPSLFPHKSKSCPPSPFLLLFLLAPSCTFHSKEEKRQTLPPPLLFLSLAFAARWVAARHQPWL